MSDALIVIDDRRVEVDVSGRPGGPGPTGPAGDVAKVETRAEMAAIAASAGASRFLIEAGRDGLFVFYTAANFATVTGRVLTAQVALDPQQGRLVAKDTDPTGADGAWVRQFYGAKNALWYGVPQNGADGVIGLQAFLDAGGFLRLPVGEYYSSAKLILRKLAVIEGEGYGFDNREAGYADMPGSRIRFPVGVDGLDIQTQTTLSDVAAVIAAGAAAWTQEGAMHSRVSNLALIGPNTGAAATGIILRTLAHLDNVHAVQFNGKGFDISATTLVDGFAEYGNASVSSLRNCRAQECGSHGLHVRGADANTILIDNFNAFDNGGNGIFEESLIGNTYLKPHCAGNDLLDIKAVRASAFNTFVHPYVESGGAVEIGGTNVIIGTDLTSVNTPPDVPPGLYSAGAAATLRYRVHWNDTLTAISTNVGYMFREATYGTVIQGKGASGDVALANTGGIVAAYVTTNTTNFTVVGNLTGGSLYTGDGLLHRSDGDAIVYSPVGGSTDFYSVGTSGYNWKKGDNSSFILTLTNAGNLTAAGNVDVASGKVYKVNGTQVVGAQGIAVADAAALTSAAGTNAVAAPTQAEFNALVTEFNKLRTDVGAVRTPLNTLLSRQRAHGLIAT